MKAVVLTRFGNSKESFQIQNKPDVFPGSQQVRIKTEGFGLNFADVMARRGLYRDAPLLPCVLGYDVAGVVDQVGPDVNQDLIGKRVLALTRFGGYAEYALTDYRACVPIPNEMSLTVACALATQYATAYFAAYERANLLIGECVLIHAAAGGVGTALIQLAKAKNCQIVALTGSDDKIPYLQELGVDLVVNYKKSDYVNEIRKWKPGIQFDVVFNSVAGSTFKKDMKMLGVNGRMILYGLAERSGKKFGFFSTLRVVFSMGRIIPVFLMMKTKMVSGVNMLVLADHKPLVLQRCLQQVIELYHQGVLSPKGETPFQVEQIAEAHDLLESGRSKGKIVVHW